MAGVSSTSEQALFSQNIVFDDDCDTTSVNDLDQGPTELRTVLLENANAAIEYLQMWDHKSPAINTEPCDYQFPVASTADLLLVFVTGGYFNVGPSFACVHEGGTQAHSAPAAPPDVRIVTTGGVQYDPAEVITPTTPAATGGALSTTLATRLGSILVQDPVADHNPRAAKASGGTVYAILIDNSANATEVFLKMYDDATVTVGTDHPFVVCRAPAGYVTNVAIPKGIVFGTAITYAVVTAGGTTGDVDPTEDVPIKLCLT